MTRGGAWRLWRVASAGLVASAVLAASGCGGADVAAAGEDGGEAATAGPTEAGEGDPTEAADPDLPSDDDVRTFVEALATYDEAQLQSAVKLTKPGSVAHGYLAYLINGRQATIDGGYVELPAGTVESKRDGYEVCHSDPEGGEDICYLYADFAGAQGKIVDFSANGRPVGPRLVLGNGRAVTGSNGVQGTLIAAYETTSSNQLVVSYELRVPDAAFYVDSTYRSPDGRQSSASNHNGPTDLGADSMANFEASFPGAKLGGVVTIHFVAEGSGTDYEVSFDTATGKR